jgi:hypothetical protein
LHARARIRDSVGDGSSDHALTIGANSIPTDWR